MITKSVNAGFRSETTINTFSDHDGSPGRLEVRLLWREINIVPTFGRRATRDRSIRAIRVGVTRQVRDKQAHRGSGVARPGRTGDEVGRCGGVLGTVDKRRCWRPCTTPNDHRRRQNHRVTQAPLVQRHPTRGDR
jgi:hypothetical protein